MTLADQIREQIRTALRLEGISQAELARQTGYTEKHVSRVLSGKDGLSFELAEMFLAVAGRRAMVTTRRVKRLPKS